MSIKCFKLYLSDYIILYENVHMHIVIGTGYLDVLSDTNDNEKLTGNTPIRFLKFNSEETISNQITNLSQ